MLVFDTNVLVYAVDEDSPFHGPCRERVSRARSDASPAFLTWSICYEFLRVTTHARAPMAPWTPSEAWSYLEILIASPGFQVLTATPRHSAVLAQTLAEHPDACGNLAHDLHTAVLMREHGISRICTRDADFRRFPFLTVIDPVG
ncbi:MAG: PIN domain-containing protein [Acidobacteria bacterium]|nr:PIN domain-containing protein [Acidobacteriota bacterium]